MRILHFRHHKSTMVEMLKKAQAVIPPAQQLWVNPDCGLKTLRWDETEKALIASVEASRETSETFLKEKNIINLFV
ncbi:hypothetical protein [Chryseobacterium sp. RLHN22]|uniref:hypothetical protein n=1 Tax=Chryseobacterium sp. RLHN22 TaxID=3437885 RepID=UPI003D9BD46B